MLCTSLKTELKTIAKIGIRFVLTIVIGSVLASCAISNSQHQILANSYPSLRSMPASSTAEQAYDVSQTLQQKGSLLEAYLYSQRSLAQFPKHVPLQQLVGELKPLVDDYRDQLNASLSITRAKSFANRYQDELALALTQRGFSRWRDLRSLEKTRSDTELVLQGCAENESRELLKLNREISHQNELPQNEAQSLTDVAYQSLRTRQSCLLSLLNIVSDRQSLYAQIQIIGSQIAKYKREFTRNRKENASIMKPKTPSASVKIDMSKKQKVYNQNDKEYELIKRSYLAALASKRLDAAQASAKQLELYPQFNTDEVAQSYRIEIETLIDREADTALQTGRRYYADGNVDLALESWKRALKLSPNHSALRESVRRVERFKRNLEALNRDDELNR